jgi:aspartyl protease family protein
VRNLKWLLLASSVLPCLAAAANVTVVGVMSGRALIQADGTSKIVTVGQTIGGNYKLVEIGTDHVVLESQGRRQRVAVGQRALGANPGEETAFLQANTQGHYFANGSINDRQVRFMVDTGATAIAMGANDARRLGIDKLPGRQGVAMTANGAVNTTCVQLEKVSLGDISMNGVEGCFAEKDMPVVLLGMSFLSRTEMKIVGSQMRLQKRF